MIARIVRARALARFATLVLQLALSFDSTRAIRNLFGKASMHLRSFISLAALSAFASPAFAQEGVTLFQGFTGTTALMVDGLGATTHSWLGTTTPGLSVYVMPNGDLMRTRNLTTGLAGAGGGIERISWDGVISWQYENFSPTLIPHHDIAVLPNGNVLMIVGEVLGSAEAVAQGREPITAGTTFTVDKIIEVQQTGPTTGAIVWEWHIWDHLVQDFDALLPNFGVVGDHPELFNLNYPAINTSDWTHLNGIDYNAELDQIAFSTPTLNQIFIIDHSTTTAEAMGHTAGNSGKGGDLLYRYGNPESYDRGTALDKVIFGVHDVQWIPRGRPGAGNLLFFNNGAGRPTGDWSSVDEIVTPVDALGNYSITPGLAFGPTSLEWTYSDIGNFFSQIMSGCQRLPNGNTLVCEATAGRLFEVTDVGATTWNYVHVALGLNWVFKARRYPETVTGVSYCYGDGGAEPGCTSCPCSNDATPGTHGGCLNSAGSSAQLLASGLPSMSGDTLRFEAQGGNPSSFSVLASADNRLPNNSGNGCFGLDSGVQSVDHDGLRCVGGGFRRHGCRAFDANGAIGTTNAGWGGTDAPAIGLIARGAFSAGQTRNYQLFYRENGALGCGTGLNTTNAVGLTFLP